MLIMEAIKNASIKSHFLLSGLLDFSTLQNAVEEADKKQVPLTTYLVKNNILKSEDILNTFKQFFNLPHFDLKNYHKNLLDQNIISIELIRKYRIIPLKLNQNLLDLGIVDPTDQQAIDLISFQTGFNINLILLDENQVSELINLYCTEHCVYHLKQVNLIKKIVLDAPVMLLNENINIDEEPLVKFVNSIISNATLLSASDIHIEPYEDHCRIRYRQQGLLLTISEITLPLAARVIMRLKVIAQLDTSEKRLPQDGRFQLDQQDIRINTCPTMFGEKVVMRLFNVAKNNLKIDALGLTVEQNKLLIHTISQSQGMILVTGPTGSGKTITLYSALNYLNKADKNISTVEDPVEIYLSGINQVSVNYKIGLDFSKILRTLLRQDPDVIMIGEIRDKETANIAIQASQTGHLVLTTLHTNSALESINRLKAIGIYSYNIVSGITLIIAQRLIRKLCDQCKIPDNSLLDSELFQKILTATVYKPKGCQFCINGFDGPMAVYEFLPMTPLISQFIVKDENSNIASELKKMGLKSLEEAALEKVKSGVTSYTEVIRVLQK